MRITRNGLRLEFVFIYSPYLIADLVANGTDRLMIRVQDPRYKIHVLWSSTQISVRVGSKIGWRGQRCYHPVSKKKKTKTADLMSVLYTMSKSVHSLIWIHKCLCYLFQLINRRYEKKALF